MTGISVIIPTYNRGRLIGETLSSLLNQTLSADEIIVVDDGSTDGTAQAAEAAFEEWKGGNLKGEIVPEFRLLRQENKGPAAARNAGFAASRGEFIHFFDSDDIALTTKHEVQLRALQQSGADIAYGPWLKGRFFAGGFQPENHVFQQKGLPHGNLVKALLTDWSIVPHACLFRRSIVEKSGGFPEDLFVGEDQLMFLNCLLHGGKVIHSPGTMELYRTENDCKITALETARRDRAIHWARFLLDADEICLRHGVNVSRWLGFRQRAWEVLEDLQLLEVTDAALEERLKQIVDCVQGGSLHKARRQLERWKGGIQRRLTGGRATKSFRSGPITREQIMLINASGYQLVDS